MSDFALPPPSPASAVQARVEAIHARAAALRLGGADGSLASSVLREGVRTSGGVNDGSAPVPIRGLLLPLSPTPGALTLIPSGAAAGSGGLAGAPTSGSAPPLQGDTAQRATRAASLAQYWPADGGAAASLPALLRSSSGDLSSPDRAAQANAQRATQLRSLAQQTHSAVLTAAGARVAPVVEAMRLHLYNPSVAEAGCVALKALAANIRCGDTEGVAAATQGMRAAVAVLRAHPDRTAVQEAALGALRALAVSCDVAEACEEGVEAVVAVLAAGGSGKVLEQACRALINFTAGDKEAQKKAVKAGATPALLELLRRHCEAPLVAEQALSALVHCLDIDDDAAAAVQQSATACVVAAMRVHAHRPGTAEAGCSCVRSLAGTAVGRSQLLTNDTALKLLLAAMRTHTAHAGTAEQACGALRTLVSSPTAKATACASGALDAVVACMTAHPASAPVQRVCTALVKSLAVLDDCRLSDAAESAVEALVAALQQHARTDECIAEEALGALCNLVVGSAENALCLCDSEGVSAVVNAISAHADNPLVLEAACACLWALTASEVRCQQRCAADGALQAVVGCMTAHPSSLPLQLVALACLKNAAQLGDNQVAIAACGGLEALINALRVHGGSAALQQVGLEALAQVVEKHAAIQRWAFTAGAMEVCTAAVTTRFPGHQGVTRAANLALVKLQQIKTPRLCGFAET